MAYIGSKNGSGVKQRIIAAMPPHDTLIILYLGSGAILRAAAPAARQIAIEKNKATLKKYRSQYPATAEIIHGCALKYLSEFTGEGMGRVLFYADPPYVKATRTKGNEYGAYEMSDLDHRFLCNQLRRVSEICGANFMLSGYDNDIYKAHLGGIDRLDYQTMTRGGPRTESLWTSFKIGGAAHWHTYAGENRDQRQRIKRKAGTWARRYENMPHGERLAIMAALIDVEARLQGSCD